MNDDEMITRLDSADTDELLTRRIGRGDVAVEHRLEQAKAAYQKLASDPDMAQEMTEAVDAVMLRAHSKWRAADTAAGEPIDVAGERPGPDAHAYSVLISESTVTVNAGRSNTPTEITDESLALTRDQREPPEPQPYPPEVLQKLFATRATAVIAMAAVSAVVVIGITFLGIFGNLASLSSAIAAGLATAVFLVQVAINSFDRRTAARQWEMFSQIEHRRRQLEEARFNIEVAQLRVPGEASRKPVPKRQEPPRMYSEADFMFSPGAEKV